MEKDHRHRETTPNQDQFIGRGSTSVYKSLPLLGPYRTISSRYEARSFPSGRALVTPPIYKRKQHNRAQIINRNNERLVPQGVVIQSQSHSRPISLGRCSSFAIAMWRGCVQGQRMAFLERDRNVVVWWYDEG